MILLKILGGIDLTSAIVFLMMLFGMNIFLQLVLFCAGLLLLKGMFVISGHVLSIIDIFSSILLILSLFFSLPTFLVWIFVLLLFAKGFVSFF